MIEITKQRIEWIDFAKGFTILLVVIGHLLLGLLQSNRFSNLDNFYLMKTTSFIYTFHMPVFFALSGYFLKRVDDNKNLVNYIGNKFITLWIPYVVFTFVMIAMKVIGSSSVREPITWQDFNFLTNPIQHLWYLNVLPVIYLVIELLFKLAKKDSIVFILTWGGYVVSSFMSFKGIHGGIYDLLMRVGTWMPFFFIGYILAKHPKYFNKSKVIFYGITFVVLECIFTTLTKEVTHYSNPKWWTLMFIVSILFGFSIYSRTEGVKNKFIQYFSKYGKESLVIYLCHAPILSITRILLFKLGVTNIFIHIIIGLMVGWYGSIAVIWLSNKLKIVNFIFYPGRYITLKRK